MMNVFDIPKIVTLGLVDYGVTGLDAFEEFKLITESASRCAGRASYWYGKGIIDKFTKRDVYLEYTPLNYGKCRLVFAMPNDGKTIFEADQRACRTYVGLFRMEYIGLPILKKEYLGIATRYPALTGDRLLIMNAADFKQWQEDLQTGAACLRFEKIGTVIAPLNGSVEVSIALGLADAIVDLVSSCETLRANGLLEVATILESEAVLIEKQR